MTLDETNKVLAILYSIWRSTEASEDLERESRIWQWAFANDPFDVVQYGVQLWIKGGNQFMPKPSQIRYILAKRSSHLFPEEEWAKVKAALIRHHRGLNTNAIITRTDSEEVWHIHPPTFHPLTQQTIDIVGEEFLRTQPENDSRKAFIFTLKNLIEVEIDRLTFGDQPLTIGPRELPKGASMTPLKP